MNALTLPDIAAQASRQALPLDWVGMCGIALPVLIDGQRLNAKADAGVSLDDSEARESLHAHDAVAESRWTRASA